jgi:hypothetical protein
MSIYHFVNNFVKGENERYSKKERKQLRQRLHTSMSKFIFHREKRLYNSIHCLKRKIKKLETKEMEMEMEEEDYIEGYKVVAVSFIRMCFIICLALIFVYIYDNILNNLKG